MHPSPHGQLKLSILRLSKHGTRRDPSHAGIGVLLFLNETTRRVCLSPPSSQSRCSGQWTAIPIRPSRRRLTNHDSTSDTAVYASRRRRTHCNTARPGYPTWCSCLASAVEAFWTFHASAPPLSPRFRGLLLVPPRVTLDQGRLTTGQGAILARLGPWKTRRPRHDQRHRRCRPRFR
jgi:hypothetical protein